MSNRYSAGVSGLALALGFLFASWLPAAVPPEQDLVIRRKIEDELKTVLNRLVSREKYAKIYGLQFPVQTPAQNLAQVQRSADTAFEQMAKEKHPDSWVDDQLQEVAGRYEQWRIGNAVLARTRDGKIHKERLRKVTNTTITIGPNEIRKEDLLTRSLLHVDPALAAKARSHDRNKLKNQLLATRATYVRELRLTDEEQFFRKAGYIKVLGEWKSEFDFFEEKISAEHEEFRKIILPSLEYKHYYNAGYRQHNDEWYDPKEAQALASAESPDSEPGGPSALDRLGSKIKAIFIKKNDAKGTDPETDESTTPKDAAQKGDAIWAILLIVVVVVVLAVVTGVVAQLLKKRR